jgi:beta-galactosidase
MKEAIIYLTQFKDKSMREIINFNKDWRFHLGGDLSPEVLAYGNMNFIANETRIWQKAGNHAVSKPENPHTDSWREVRVPHDFVLEGEFTNKAPLNNGSLMGSEAWYVKKFDLSAQDGDKRIVLEFDGVYRDSTLYVNGQFIGRHMSGYTSFSFDITDVCRFGEKNALAIHVDARENELWSYEGGGIYREVRLVKTADVAIPVWGTYVTTGGEDNPGLVKAEITVTNHNYSPVNVTIINRILDEAGHELARDKADVKVDDISSSTLKREMTVKNPGLWGPDSPTMYKQETTLEVDGQITDKYETPFGFRYFRFDANTGFYLNGESMKFKGVCVHQDHGCVGVAVPPAIQEWRVKKLKEMGCNAIRTSHNPPDPILMDMCDRHGIMVMDEQRLSGTSNEILQQLEDLIRRDRNHPSVIFWSVGNEEMGIQDTPQGERIFKRMNHLAKRLDPSRVTTYAMNCDWQNITDRYGDDREGRFDVFGHNYRGGGNDPANFDLVHKKYPDWPMVGSESWGGTATRDMYEPDKASVHVPTSRNWAATDFCWKNEDHKFFVTDYDDCHTPWGCDIEDTWRNCVDRPYQSGTFLWTGFDYRGETFPYDYPAVVTRFGIMDLCGFYKSVAHYLRAWWRPESPHIFLMPHWDFPGHEGKKKLVRCYANTARVELLLNGKSLGIKDMPENFRLEWTVPWEAGTLEARGVDSEGKEIIRTQRVTPSAPAKVILESDRDSLASDGDDVIVINARIDDEKGNICPRADNLVEFQLDGPAEIIGVGNGNHVSHEADLFTNQRKAFHGLCQVMLRSTGEKGEVTISTFSRGLDGGSFSFMAE